MNRDLAFQFCYQHANRRFYQPIIFVPGVIEIPGKWQLGTQELASLIFADCFGQSVLDLGCMHGYFLHEAARRGTTKNVGIDHDTVELSIAKEINEIFNDGVILIESNIEHYEPPHSFDIILMMNIMHVLEDPVRILAKYFRYANKQIIVEHEEEHEKYFPRKPDLTIMSPRCAGHRKLSRFLV